MGRESECICGGTSRRWVVQGSAGGASRKLSYIQTSGGTNVRVRTLLNLLSLLNPCGALTLYWKATSSGVVVWMRARYGPSELCPCPRLVRAY